MKLRSVPPMLFFGLAVIYAGMGIYSRGAGLAANSIPLAWVTLPGLIPFAAAILCVTTGVIYLAVDRKSIRRASTTIAVVQLGAFVVGVAGYAAVARFWWIATGLNPPASSDLPLWSAGMAAVGLIASLLLFLANPVADAHVLARKNFLRFTSSNSPRNSRLRIRCARGLGRGRR